MSDDIIYKHLILRFELASDLPTTAFQQTMLGFEVGLTVLCFLAFALRAYSRFLTKQFGLDDCLAGIATALAIIGTGANYAYCKYAFVGFPAKSPDRLNQDTKASAYWGYIQQLTYNPVLAIVKSSVLILLLRIGGHRTRVKWTIYVLNTVNILLMIATFLVATFQTLPIQAQWDPTVKVTNTIHVGDFSTATSAITVFRDLLVLCIPVWLFTSLQMRFEVKLGLIAVFLLSGVVTAVGIIRLVMFRVAWDSPETLDYFNSWGPVLGQIESALAIITACIPTLKPVAAIWFPALLPTKTDNYGSENFMASRTFGGTAVTRPGHSSVVPNTFVLRNLGRTRNTIRGHSPSESEEEIMAAHGITRTTRVNISYDIERITTKESHEETSSNKIQV